MTDQAVTTSLVDALAVAREYVAKLEASLMLVENPVTADLQKIDAALALAKGHRPCVVRPTTTPTPWTYDRSTRTFRGPDGDLVLYMRTSGRHVDAELIVRAVNAHDELVDALKNLHAMVCGECPSLLDEDSGGCARLDMEIKNALALARGETP